LSLSAVIAELPLIDHHAHAALARDLSRPEFEQLITESDRAPAAGTSGFDSQLGFAIRRWCAPVLGLEPYANEADYLRRRGAFSETDVARRFLSAARSSWLLLDTGFEADGSLRLGEMAELSGATASEVVRIEAVAEQAALTAGGGAAAFAGQFADALRRRATAAVALKSIIAYRLGLDFDPAPPTKAEVTAAAGQWLREIEDGGRARLTDPVLLRHVLWTGTELGLPVQLHTGLGDPDLDLSRCDPALASRFLADIGSRGVPIMLLHCYPFHRSAGYLAQAFPHVYLDVGEAINYVGARATAIVAESLELAPFGKVLYSSDAYGLPELHFLGALLWRRATARVLGDWVAAGDWTEADAIRVATMIASGNAARVYRLGDAV